MNKIISGIQQIGVGVPNFKEAWNWYIDNFNMNIRVFEDEAVAELMLPHTEGKTRKRVAALALNMEGGGGFEIWQHTGKTPQMSESTLHLGDLGINYAKMKCRNIEKKYTSLKNNNVELLGEITQSPNGINHFFAKDLYGNIFEFIEEQIFFAKRNNNGGCFGVVIGVKNIEESLSVYQDILEYETIVYDKTDTFKDLKTLKGGEEQIRRVLLIHKQERKGAFSKLLGPSQIELIEVKSRKPKNIFEGRIWGDPGFIHLCFDINGMKALRNECKSKGFPFTVDSENNGSTFDMGEAGGSFAYIQAPEGTLIEFVETHKVPIVKKIGWYLNLRKRKPIKDLPLWMLKTLEWGKVKHLK